VYGAGGIGVRSALRHWLGPLTVPAAARRVRRALLSIGPDLVHALRVPFEGMLAAAADPAAPLLISVWGNDFTLHAPASPGMRRLTRHTLLRADGLQADCHRDLRLAERWGLRPGTPSDVIPGNGGVRREHFLPSDGAQDISGPHPPGWERIPVAGPIIVNPRGFRGYVRNDTFFTAIPLVLQERPEAFFVCPGMAGEQPALRWAARFGIEDQVLLLPSLSPAHMGALFRRAQLSVSPSQHDGTPNTLLEAMACGSFPVAGDLESIREWIEPGANGLVFDPADPRALGEAILQALGDERLRATAARVNQRLIAERGTYEAGMAKAERLYRRLTGLE
jgi:glycosyltransferase involved in cell wall biosynthesis